MHRRGRRIRTRLRQRQANQRHKAPYPGGYGGFSAQGEGSWTNVFERDGSKRLLGGELREMFPRLWHLWLGMLATPQRAKARIGWRRRWGWRRRSCDIYPRSLATYGQRKVGS